jgi:predicted Zn-dependent protease
VVRLLDGDAAGALKSFGEALKLEPGNPSALVCAAEALVEAGNPGKALAVVEKAMGDRPDAWLIAAAAAERLGAADDARLFLSKAKERTARGGYECLHRAARHEALERSLAG